MGCGCPAEASKPHETRTMSGLNSLATGMTTLLLGTEKIAFRQDWLAIKLIPTASLIFPEKLAVTIVHFCKKLNFILTKVLMQIDFVIAKITAQWLNDHEMNLTFT